METNKNGVQDARQNVPPNDPQWLQRVHWVGDWH